MTFLRAESIVEGQGGKEGAPRERKRRERKGNVRPSGGTAEPQDVLRDGEERAGRECREISFM